MSDIDWKAAPISADRIVENPMDYSPHWGSGKEVLIYGNWKSNSTGYLVTAPRPTAPQVGQRKTVEDAVEYFKGVWPDDIDGALCHDHEKGWGLWNLDWDKCYSFYQVCTREQFESCVAAKSEPEWTHEYGYRKCRVIYTEGDSSWVAIEGIGQKIVPTVAVHPIKPTITKAEA